MDVPQPLTDLGFDTAATARLVELLKVTLEATCKKIFADSQMSAVAVSKSPGTELKAADKLKATDLRTALLTGKIPEDTGLLIDAATFAKLLSISSRHLRRLLDLKAVPQPVHLGRLVRWRLTEVLEWIEDDCPPQRTWTSTSTTRRRKS